MHITDLPADIWRAELARYLTPVDLEACRNTCRALRRLAVEPLWPYEPGCKARDMALGFNFEYATMRRHAAVVCWDAVAYGAGMAGHLPLILWLVRNVPAVHGSMTRGAFAAGNKSLIELLRPLHTDHVCFLECHAFAAGASGSEDLITTLYGSQAVDYAHSIARGVASSGNVPLLRLLATKFDLGHSWLAECAAAAGLHDFVCEISDLTGCTLSYGHIAAACSSANVALVRLLLSRCAKEPYCGDHDWFHHFVKNTPTLEVMHELAAVYPEWFSRDHSGLLQLTNSVSAKRGFKHAIYTDNAEMVSWYRAQGFSIDLHATIRKCARAISLNTAQQLLSSCHSSDQLSLLKYLCENAAEHNTMPLINSLFTTTEPQQKLSAEDYGELFVRAVKHNSGAVAMCLLEQRDCSSHITATHLARAIHELRARNPFLLRRLLAELGRPLQAAIKKKQAQ